MTARRVSHPPLPKSARLREEFGKVLPIIEAYAPRVDPSFQAPPSEFRRRQRAVQAALKKAGFAAGIVFSDEHYAGDVPYLGGNYVSIEQVAGVIGPTGFHIAAGLEGGYIAEQTSGRAGAPVHKVEMLQLADEQYPVRAERFEAVIEAAAGVPLGRVKRVALLTPRQVMPASVVAYIEKLFGPANVVDAQVLYQRVKHEKSAVELRLIADACAVADAMMRGMLAVLKPGMLETEVAAWGYFIGRELGCEDCGFKVILGANEANRTLIGKALNRPIREGDWVHLGAAPTRDGMNSCIRRSVIAVRNPRQVTPAQQMWFDFIEEAYQIGEETFAKAARQKLPARRVEEAVVNFFRAQSPKISRLAGRKLSLEALKPYSCTHNTGYTECQEFYGAITLDSHEPLGRRIVNMLDVALRGIGDHWDDVIIPGFDYIVVENTLAKDGPRVERLTKLPVHAQGLVGVG